MSRDDATTAGGAWRQAPTQAGRDGRSAVLGSPRPLGLPRPGPDGTHRGPWRRKGWQAAVGVPFAAPKLHQSSWTSTSTSQKFEFRGPRTAPSRQARLDRAVDGSRKFSTLNSPWPWRSKYEPVARCQRDARPKASKSEWPHTQRQKRRIALEAPSPASAAQSAALCTLPLQHNAARGGGA